MTSWPLFYNFYRRSTHCFEFLILLFVDLIENLNDTFRARCFKRNTIIRRTNVIPFSKKFRKTLGNGGCFTDYSIIPTLVLNLQYSPA